MVFLDSDHMSLIERGGAESQRIRARLRTVPLDDVATTIISYEEQTRGWLARIAQVSTAEQQIFRYGELLRQLRNYCDIAIVPYDAKAAQIYEDLRRQRIRIGTQDLKIAAITLANDALLLTRNTQHFAKVPNLKHEDWSV